MLILMAEKREAAQTVLSYSSGFSYYLVVVLVCGLHRNQTYYGKPNSNEFIIKTVYYVGDCLCFMKLFSWEVPQKGSFF